MTKPPKALENVLAQLGLPPQPSGWTPQVSNRLPTILGLQPHFYPVTGFSQALVKEIDWVRFPGMLLLGFNQIEHGKGLSSISVPEHATVLYNLCAYAGVQNVTVIVNRGADGLGRQRQELHGREVTTLAEYGWGSMWRYAFSTQFEAKW